MSYEKRETIVIYHKNCLDGFGAAFAIWKAQLPTKLKFIPMDYNERESWITSVRNNIEDWAQKDFIVVDFSFSNEDTEYLVSISNTFTWLDHHKTAFDNWCGETYLAENSKYEYKDSRSTIILDNEKSGAVLAWEHFHPYQPLPDALIFIQDRDLWNWHYPDTKAFTRSLSMLPQDFKVWEQVLSPNCVTEMITKGEAINEYYAEQLTRSIEATKESCQILGNVGLCCNLPPMFASEAGNVLARESGTFGATWFKDKDGNIKWSLRSIGDYDVSAIARSFGGGGHKNAAGFVLTPSSGETVSGIKLWHTGE